MGRPVILLSAPDAGIYGGGGWFAALIANARAMVPHAPFSAVLDCGDDAGAAMAAIRAGVEAVVCSGRADVAERLAQIAEQQSSVLLTARPAAALDFGNDFFASEEILRRRCADALASPPTI